MNVSSTQVLPEFGSSVTTACGGGIVLEFDTPRSIYHGQWTFFCLPSCKVTFLRNPRASCLAVQLALEKDEE